jgi:hypothetical protein
MLTTFLVLHPRHKLEYFKKQKWEDSWIQDAHDIVRRNFDRSYAMVDAPGDEDAIPVCNGEPEAVGNILFNPRSSSSSFLAQVLSFKYIRRST